MAAKVLTPGGDNPQRLRSEAAWANLCGVAPLEASLGKVVRHRLNRGGDREANNALYRIVNHPAWAATTAPRPTSRRRAEGKSTGETAESSSAT